MGMVCRVVHLNCEVIDTQYRVLAQISKCLLGPDETASDKLRAHIPMTGWPTDQVYQELKNQLESHGGVLIIILDEIDKLVKKSGDETLYNLTRINADLKKSKVSMIGISNDLSFKDFLDPRVLSSLSEEELVFPPYNAPQLCDILQQRAEASFVENALDEGVIPLCAALAAQEHGDARRALTSSGYRENWPTGRIPTGLRRNMSKWPRPKSKVTAWWNAFQRSHPEQSRSLLHAPP